MPLSPDQLKRAKELCEKAKWFGKTLETEAIIRELGDMGELLKMVPALLAEVEGHESAIKAAKIEGMRMAAKVMCEGCRVGHVQQDGFHHYQHGTESCNASLIHDAIASLEK